METRQKQPIFSPESISWSLQKSVQQSIKQNQQNRKKKQELYKQWEEVCQRQQDAHKRNLQLLNDVRRVERQLSLLTAKTELFKKKKDNYMKDMQKFLSLPPEPDLASHYTTCENEKCSGYFRDTSLRGCCHSRDANMPLNCWCMMYPYLRGHFEHSVSDQSNIPHSMDLCQPRESSASQDFKYTHSNLERSGTDSCPLARYDGLKGVSEKTTQKAKNITKRSHSQKVHGYSHQCRCKKKLGIFVRQENLLRHGEMITRKDIHASGRDQNLDDIPVQPQVFSSDSSSENHAISSSKSDKYTGKLLQCPSNCKKSTTICSMLQYSKTDHRAEKNHITSDSLGGTSKDSYRISYALTKVENRASKLKTSDKIDINSKIASKIDHDKEEDAISCQTEDSDNIFDITEKSEGNHNIYSPKQAEILGTAPSAWGEDDQISVEDQREDEEETDDMQAIKDKKCKPNYKGSVFGEVSATKKTELISSSDEEEKEMEDESGVESSENKQKEILIERNFKNEENHIPMGQDVKKGVINKQEKNTIKEDESYNSSEEEEEVERDSSEKSENEMNVGIGRVKEIIEVEFTNSNKNVNIKKGLIIKEEKETSDETESDNNSEEEEEEKRDESDISENEMNDRIVEEIIKEEGITSRMNENVKKGGNNKEEKDTSEEDESDKNSAEEEEEKMQGNISETKINKRIVIVEERKKEEGTNSNKNENAKKVEINKEKKDMSEEVESDNNSVEGEEKRDDSDISESEINDKIVRVEEIRKGEGTNGSKNENGGINTKEKNTSEEDESDYNSEEEDEEKKDSENSENEMNDRVLRVEEIREEDGINKSKNENKKHESDDSKDESEEEEPTGSLKNSRIDIIKHVDVENNRKVQMRKRDRESSWTEECKPTPNVESTSGEDEFSSKSSDEEMEEESEGDKSVFGDDNEEEEIDEEESVNEENGNTWDSEEDRPKSSNKDAPNKNKEKSLKSENLDEVSDVQVKDSLDSALRKEDNFSKEPDLVEVQSTELPQEDQMEQEKERKSSAQKKRCSEDCSIDGLEMIPVESGSVLPCQDEEPQPFSRTPESLPEASAGIADSSEDSPEENPESENNAGSQQESDSEDDVHSFYD